MNILICDKDISYNYYILNDYNITLAYNEQNIIDFTYEKNIDLVVVNFYFFSTIKYIKDYGNKSVVLFLDEYYDINHLKLAFDIGDGYLIKPINLQELKIRVDYFYKKLFSNTKQTIRYEDFFYNIKTKQLFKKDKKVKLSPSEIKLVELFLYNQNSPITKDRLFDELESYSDGSLRVYISKLHKIGFNIDYNRTTCSYILTK